MLRGCMGHSSVSELKVLRVECLFLRRYIAVISVQRERLLLFELSNGAFVLIAVLLSCCALQLN